MLLFSIFTSHTDRSGLHLNCGSWRILRSVTRPHKLTHRGQHADTLYRRLVVQYLGLCNIFSCRLTTTEIWNVGASDGTNQMRNRSGYIMLHFGAGEAFRGAEPYDAIKSEFTVPAGMRTFLWGSKTYSISVYMYVSVAVVSPGLQARVVTLAIGRFFLKFDARNF